LLLLGGDEGPAVMRFFGIFRYPARHRNLLPVGGFKWMTNDGTRTLVCELLSMDIGK